VVFKYESNKQQTEQQQYHFAENDIGVSPALFQK